MRSFIAELKRRHVFRVGVIYLAFLIGVLAFASDLESTFGLHDWTDRTMVILSLIGLPIALIFAWAYELTPQGIVRETDFDAEEAAGVPPKPNSELASIAVLPFGSVAQAGDAFLAKAIPLELNHTLSRIQRLRVVSGQSTLALSSDSKDLKTIASELSVDYVISGSVSQMEGRLKVIAELYDAKNDTLLWNERFDLRADEAFDADRRIAEAVAMAFGGERLRLEVEEARKGQTNNLAAWELVQRARGYLFSYTLESVDAAVSLLRQAVEQDETYAVGHAQLAQVTAEKTLNALGSDPEGDRATALTAIERAESLAPNDPVVLRSAGVVHAYVGHNSRSLRLLRRATALAPYDLGAWGYLGWPLVGTGQIEHRAELFEILARLLSQGTKHPGRPFWLFHKSVALCCEGRHEDALECLDHTLVEQPHFAMGWMHAANLHGILDRQQTAKDAVVRSLQINPGVTPHYYAELIQRISDDSTVVEQRTVGLRTAGLLTEPKT